MYIEYFLAFSIPVFFALLFTPWIIKLAKLIGAVDKPNERKIHIIPTPRIGGVAVFLSILASGIVLYFTFPNIFTETGENNIQLPITLMCLLFIFTLGFVDDLKSLKPGIKFGVQFLIAGLIYYAGFRISNITNPIGTGMLNVEVIDFPLTVLWIVGITNAFNLIDGLDGLSSGVAAIASISIFMVSALSEQYILAMTSLVLAGALTGFLKYNFRPAKIFLGDSGSLVIGFTLAILSIQSTTKISTGLALCSQCLYLACQSRIPSYPCCDVF
jgi:UDP-GlcNAc:undecaprenyl-phosphate/decaprenyl-phosphate GlcNAc-1-phosphate transferase